MGHYRAMKDKKPLASCPDHDWLFQLPSIFNHYGVETRQQ